MKQAREYPQVKVSKKAEHAIIKGHPWVYFNEITEAQPFENGELVDVVSQKGSYLGTGFANENSKIRVRLISRNANDKFDEAFFERRLRHAIDYRKTVMGDDFSNCRLIFGEADSFPGLTVDRFGDILVAQVLSLGIEKRKKMLFELLAKIFAQDNQPIRGIYERNDVAIRELEGMEQYKGFFPLEGYPIPDSTETTITENGITYAVDFENGQKTGFFLDQKYNRLAVAKLSRGKRVLDCFTHTGSFGLNAAKGGAEYVLSVDISESAVEMAQKNAKANGLDGKVEYLAANVFDLLPKLSEGEMINRYGKFDFIILDPPAFTKSRQTVESAMRGYKEINLRAMRLLPRGGYLATCSCSHFMTEQLFVKMLHQAAADAGVSLRQIEARQQSPDHPILWNVEETNYLKFYLFQVV
ncbi:MAG: class I SAM-dependent rRNA methyltransferase [Negativibacillus massiliensis]|jgi:23S rRNA (cytosine1962-C5)-methyltransferase|uniref:class I SAM-dependent rRNA methyltransferase n=1 Tax=Negativibacillus massiliensis TaxID=1871035 RepID=UPI0023F3F550|nr:class I SAM-dependent rRNA methyltransferase [Negativibacillus massiliensis]MCI6348946.1 class I SAM-dependent rRNA methyltransferase [Negativibacillus massiliensis]MDY4048459.1 class I SAM-dependent rRNA methyltransferase [Negativibacillus massiliensis]